MWFMWISISISSTLHCNILTPIDHASLISSHFRQIISFVSYSSSVSLFLLLLIPKWIFPPQMLTTVSCKLQNIQKSYKIKVELWKRKEDCITSLTILIFNLWIASIALFVCLFLVVCFTETGLTVLMEIYRLKLKVALISPIITF